jgi:hypothetical protein
MGAMAISLYSNSPPISREDADGGEEGGSGEVTGTSCCGRVGCGSRSLAIVLGIFGRRLGRFGAGVHGFVNEICGGSSNATWSGSGWMWDWLWMLGLDSRFEGVVTGADCSSLLFKAAARRVWGAMRRTVGR